MSRGGAPAYGTETKQIFLLGKETQMTTHATSRSPKSRPTSEKIVLRNILSMFGAVEDRGRLHFRPDDNVECVEVKLANPGTERRRK